MRIITLIAIILFAFSISGCEDIISSDKNKNVINDGELLGKKQTIEILEYGEIHIGETKDMDWTNLVSSEEEGYIIDKIFLENDNPAIEFMVMNLPVQVNKGEDFTFPIRVCPYQLGKIEEVMVIVLRDGTRLEYTITAECN